MDEIRDAYIWHNHERFRSREDTPKRGDYCLWCGNVHNQGRTLGNGDFCSKRCEKRWDDDLAKRC